MTQKQRQAPSREEPPQDDEAPGVSRQVSRDTEDMLGEIDCCLAEHETDAEAELKAAAEAEYRQIRGMSISTADGWFDRQAYAERMMQMQVWMAKNAHLFEFCCGAPIFDE